MKRMIIIYLLISGLILTGCSARVKIPGITESSLKTSVVGQETDNVYQGEDIKTDPSSVQVQNTPVRINWDRTGCSNITIDKIVDGDTYYDKSGRLIRLIGVDSPENAVSGPAEFFAQEAKIFANQTLSGKELCIKDDVSTGSNDRYGRIPAYLYLDDGNLFNASLVRWGYAKVITNAPAGVIDILLAKEKQAKIENLGVWNIEAKSDYYNEIGRPVDNSELAWIRSIQASFAREFVGQDMTVSLIVESTYASDNEIFLNSTKDFYAPDNFTVVIPRKVITEMNQIKISPLSYYRKKQVTVTGKISQEKSSVRIIIDNSNDLNRVE